MKRVVDLLEQLGGMASKARQKPLSPVEARKKVPTLLKFDFVDDEAEIFAESETQSTFSGTLGLTQKCISSVNLSDRQCLQDISHKRQIHLSYLQSDQRGAKETIEKIEKILQKQRRKAKKPIKVRSTALVEASELLKPQADFNDKAYKREIARAAKGKEVSLEMLRKLGQRSSEEELLEKIKDAYGKISAEALFASPVPGSKETQQRCVVRINIC